ncbi:MAG TPA: MBL fold metallo-hydrolase [Thermoanaerobaculia bacterium]|nr:MBL fold metallo-hydrolase [Thermoanaerobaculia bacterium]
MNRSLVALAFALAAFPLAAQQDLSKVEIRVHPVAGAVYMLQGAGGNIGVSAGEDGIVIVDDQYAPLAPKIKAALATITDEPVRFVLNTHYHGDHTGGNEIFGESAPIVAHENVRKRLAEGVDAPGRRIPPAPPAALPVITFNDRVTVHVNGEDLRALHVPRAHTDGDSVVFFTRSNVVHMGDLFFSGLFPFIDIDGGGSVRGLIRGIERVLEKIPPGAKVIPGHGPISDAAGLRGYLEMLVATSAAVEKALAEGKSAAQMKEEKILAPWDSWSWGFITTDRFIDTLVRDLGE